MTKYLSKVSKEIALILLTIFYCQIIFSAYEPWRNFKQQYIQVFSTDKFFNILAAPASITYPHKEITSVFLDKTSRHKTAFSKNNNHKNDEIGGPTQPEMTAFKSVNDNNMVDLFTGDFSYNIPLLDVGGYPINLFYKSGVSMDQEASWVGLGWNINPGTITRNLRGIPDDFDGKNDIIQKTTSVKENKTIGGNIGGDIEVFGLPIDKFLDSVKLSLGASAGVFYNNYRGWGLENSFNASISAGKPSMGYLTAGLSLNNNSQQGLNVSPSLSVQLQTQLEQGNSTLTGGVSIGGGLSYNSRSGLVSNLSTGVNLSLQQQSDRNSKILGASADDVGTNLYGSYISFASPSYNPSASIPFTNTQFTFTGKLGGALVGTHASVYLKGYVSKQYIAEEDKERTFPAYGYLYYQDANNNPQALLDFNREKDIVYRETPEVPNIAIPSYTYDLFSISGEGTGGMFRAYRGDIGYVHDPYVTTKDNSDAASIDLGFGNLFHGGIDINVNHATTTTGAWIDGNPLINSVQFKQNDSIYEAAYLRNPGEKSINTGNFYKNIGDDDVVTAQLYQGTNGPVINTTNYLQHWKNKTAANVSTLLDNTTDFKTKRDKRTQVISYLNAAEASRIGLDTIIYNYGLNQWSQPGCSSSIKKESRVNSFRHSNHMSEIDVLNADGRRYVYGLPVYNLIQQEVTFAADSQHNNKITGMVKYGGNDANKYNNRGKDNYYEKEVTSAYTHSFLLTAILSPDYVDVTGNGITEDDLGDAIKLNYSKLAGLDSAFGWRTPNVKDSATFNEGLQTYNRDDKGNYLYGEKEMWYLNSVESKNMVAVFILQRRSDLKSITETGNVVADTTKSKCLKEIDLYSKSDYIQNGSKAKPIKIVHFAYTYNLCKGINGDISQGKLTLTKVWFTYNGNDKGIKNPYLFFYGGVNPDYTNTAYDRWGNYKNLLQNPRSTQSKIITNAEYPYALQDNVSSNLNAAAWTMDSIILPSSGSLKVGYESDDYAYVQNKRAMQMFNVVGLSYGTPSTFYSSSTISNISNTLYGFQGFTTIADNRYISVRISNAVFSAKDVYLQYLEGLQKIYFKLRVEMPTDEWGSGYEYVPVYADLNINTIGDSANYGIVPGHNDVIWFELKGININGDGGGDISPLAKTAIQFLRLNLPTKAYPGYETEDKLDVGVAVKMIGALGSNIFNAFTSFDNNARSNGWGIQIDTSKTLARLDNPIFKKYGGGLRVKYIKIYDNWKNMTDSSKQAVYGQVYDYSTIKNINGIDTRISSGVANWEPMMGKEENPFTLPLEYIDKVAPLAPVTMGYTEIPLGETFFPAPSVGYSEVRVRSIHSTNIKSATGYTETKFYTSYDFPTITDNSLFTPDTKKRYRTSLTDFLRINSYHFLSMSQGFKIELNDMNGKIKSQSTYSETDSVHPIASSQYYYHVDDQNAEFKHVNNTIKTVTKDGVIDTTGSIGKDIELMMDMRQQQSLTQGVDYGLNVDVFVIFAFPIPVPSYIPMPQREETRFQSVATTKIIQRFGILDSVVVIDKGSKISTDNLLYDSETGDVLLTRTRNEFKDTLYNLKYPAHWAYSGMGPAYQNIDARYNSDQSNDIKFLNGVLQSTPKYPGMISRFESGDEILASGKNKIGENIPSNCSGQTGCSTQIFSTNYDTTRIWAVDSKKIDSSTSTGLIFLDRNGTLYTADQVSLKVLRSGHRNLNEVVGTLTSLKTPIRKIGTFLKLVIDSLDNIISTNNQIFNEFWKTENYSKEVDSCIHQTFWGTKNLTPQNIISLRYLRNEDDDVHVEASNYNNNSRLVAGYYFKDKQDFFGCNTQQKAVRTVFNFDFNLLPANPVIDAAIFNLTAGSPRNTNISGDIVQWDNVTYAHDYNDDAGHNGSEIHLYTTNIIGDTSPYAVQYDNSDSASLTIGNTSKASCTSFSPTATTLIRKYLNNKSSYYGFMIKDVNDVENFGNCNLGNRFMSFCAVNDNHSQNDCQYCSQSSYLYLSYHYDSVICISLCKSAITQLLINPYVHGILGNWRANKSFVYYSQRRELNPNTTTDIRNNGIIQNFTPYWSFGSSYLNPTLDTSTYVWNSESTLYNRKGFEIENKDPLGRYNSGAYGYNGSLPIDVVQNGKYKDQFFDGFEDYGYSTQTCSRICSTVRNIDFTSSGSSLTTSFKHSGKFSLKISGLDSSFQTFSIRNDTLNDVQKITLPKDSSNIDTIVSPQGTGLLTNTDFNSNVTRYYGYIQSSNSGYYTITSSISHTNYTNAPQGYSLQVNGISNAVYDNVTSDISVTAFLTAGQKIYMYVDCNSGSYFTGSLTLKWERVGTCNTGQSNIPTINLYASANADNSVSYGSALCSVLKGVRADSSSLLLPFEPSQGKRMIFSAWVKEQKNCLCQQYDSNRVVFTFSRSQHTDTTLSFKPTGNIIEGWQRYDTVLSVPLDATSMRITFKSTSNSPVYFDDVRMLPFNANMKSYVYDPASLRLMAELDENNYATFYEYDDDGTLIRVKKETERGIQTVKETRSSLSEINNQ